MKYISAIIKPFKLDELRDALMDVGVTGITVTEINGFELRQMSDIGEYVPQLKIEVAILDRIFDVTLNAIVKVINTGNTSDCKIVITELVEVVRIRTFERGFDAV